MINQAVNKDPTTQRESFTELLGQFANNSAAPVLAAFVTGTALALIGVVISVTGYRQSKKSTLKP